MTDHSNASESELPTFSVNVTPAAQIRGRDLRTMLDRFRRGETEPLIFGDDNKPEAAVIPFAAFVRLLRHDHAEHIQSEAAFHDEVAQRLQDADADQGESITLEQLADSLGEPAASILRKSQTDGQ